MAKGSDLMLVYGKNVLYEIDRSKIKKAYISRNDYMAYLKENNIKYEYVDKNRLDKMVGGVHQGIVLDIFDYSYYTFDDIEGDFIVMLDHLTDPHNFGAIIRTCESKGIKTIIIPKDRSVLVNDTVYKTSEGAIDNVKIVMVTNLINTINKLKEMNYFVYCADMDGEDYSEIDYPNKLCVVIGNEGKGVSDVILKSSDFVASIPMSGKINSLNASVSCGIVLSYIVLKRSKS